jgi:CheY-like chemotaxis protein
LLPHVFELFTQGKRTPDRAQGGLGLGLALARTIVAAHGGSIEADSAGLGQGSRFTVTLPLCPGALPAAPLRAASGAAGTRAAHHAGRRQPRRRRHAERPARRGRTPGGDAGRSARRFAPALRDPPDVFILDIGMPGMDGHELARQLRQEPALRDAVYIALTGYGQPRDRECRAGGLRSSSGQAGGCG